MQVCIKVYIFNLPTQYTYGGAKCLKVNNGAQGKLSLNQLLM